MQLVLFVFCSKKGKVCCFPQSVYPQKLNMFQQALNSLMHNFLHLTSKDGFNTYLHTKQTQWLET